MDASLALPVGLVADAVLFTLHLYLRVSFSRTLPEFRQALSPGKGLESLMRSISFMQLEPSPALVSQCLLTTSSDHTLSLLLGL